MPWKMVKDGSQWCIRKKLEDGTLGELVKGSCHKSRTMTLRMLRALFMNAAEMADDSDRTIELANDSDRTIELANDLVAEITRVLREKFGDDFSPIDIWDDHIIVTDTRTDDLFRVAMDLSAEDFALAEPEAWTPVHYAAEMRSSERIYDAMAVWEFKGAFPDVPVSPKVNLKELLAGDDDPFFVTLPIAKANTISRNRRFYGEDIVNELGRIVNEELPGALMGHLPPGEEGHAFPSEAAFWVGAKRVGEFLWGKAYVPRGEIRERFRRYKALGKRVATSIDATLKGVWDSAVNATRMLAEDAILHSIDFAPLDRAGIPDLGAVPVVTREMCGDCSDVKNADKEGSTKMDGSRTMEDSKAVLDSKRINEILGGLKAEDAQYLPDEVRKAILSEVQEIGLVRELRGILGEDTDLVARVKELVGFQQAAQRDAVSRRIHELVADKRVGVQIEGLRPLVIRLIEMRSPKTVEEVDIAFTEVMRSAEVRSALENYVTATMGVVDRAAMTATPRPKYFNIPEADKPQVRTGKYFNIPETK